ncbi:hypothetical protein [Azospirillum sp. ST 5-10]|uniref:hypothetical protein n=1 Tax=unclassified Azospirillum TaxID=2630922 RepID=UPI003F4A4229
MERLSRRTALAGLAAAQRLPELVLRGPPAGPSITLVHGVRSRSLHALADRVAFRAWRNPDALRAGLTSWTMELFALPTVVAANPHDRGLGVRLVNVLTERLLHLPSPDRSLGTVAALKGRSVAVPFRNDPVELVLHRLLAAAGLTADVSRRPRFTGTPMEAGQLLFASRVDAAPLPEPAMTAAILWAGEAGREVFRTLDVQRAWGEATGLPAVLPQAGLGVSAAFLGARRPAVAAVHRALVEAAAVVADPVRVARPLLTVFLGVPPVARIVLTTLGLRHAAAFLFPALTVALGTASRSPWWPELLANTGGTGGALATARANLAVAGALAWVLIAVAGLAVVKYALMHPVRAEVERWRDAARPRGVNR